MKRVILITLTVMLVSAIIFGGCAKPAEEAPTTPAEPEVKPIEWRYASFVPPASNFSVDAVEWAKRVEEATDGRLKMTFYFSESLLKMAGEFDGVASGTADIATPAVSMWMERFPLNQFISLLWILRHPTQAGQTVISMLNKSKEFRDEFLPTRVLWFNCPTPDELQSKRPIQTMEDLKGLKIRASTPSVIKAYQLLGAVPVTVTLPEAYHAMETGIIDAATENWDGAYLWKMHEVTKYRVDKLSMRHRGFPVLMNIASYNKLPEDVRRIFDELTDPMQRTIDTNKVHEEFDLGQIEKIREYDKKVGNPPWYVLPEAERERWKEVTQPVNEEIVELWEKKGLPGKAFYEDIIAFAEQYE